MKKNDKNEILEAIQGLGQKIDGVEHKLSDQIDSLAVEVHGVKSDVQVLKGDVQVLKGDVQELKEDLQGMHGAMNAFSSETDRSLASIKALMVTKDYLDAKLADQRSDIVNQVKRQMPEWVKAGS